MAEMVEYMEIPIVNPAGMKLDLLVGGEGTDVLGVRYGSKVKLLR
jgi:hypothetical protein